MNTLPKLAIDKPGVYDLSEPQYHADPCIVPSLSGSMAVTLYRECPIKAWRQHPRLNPDYEEKNSATFDLGTAAHQLILGKADNLVIVQHDDWRTNAAKAARAQAYLDGKTPILAHQHADVIAMADAFDKQIALTQHPEIFKGGKPEQTLLWEEDGVWFRCMIDYLKPGDIIPDYKTSGPSANPETWSRHLFDMGYDIKAALYSRGMRKVLGVENPRFVWAVQEKDAPYCLSLVELTYVGLVEAHEKLDEAIKSWKWCAKNGSWPGYPAHIVAIGPKPWESIRLEERKAAVASYGAHKGIDRNQMLINAWAPLQVSK